MKHQDAEYRSGVAEGNKQEREAQGQPATGTWGGGVGGTRARSGRTLWVEKECA